MISLVIEGLILESVELKLIFQNLIQNKNKSMLDTMWQMKLLTVILKI